MFTIQVLNFLLFSFRKGGVAEGKGEAVGGEGASYRSSPSEVGTVR